MIISNIDDRVPVEKLTHNLRGLAAADKGYIGKELEALLEKNNLKLITKARKNMKKKMRGPSKNFSCANGVLS